MSEASAPGESLLRRGAPELALILVAATMFVARLGAMDLWGKREQRAVAEALNTVDEHNWLVAKIQSRPRLEKPPLPRWTTALLMVTTGLRDEWLMRLPSALSALGMIGLVYGLGRRLGGRDVGVASGLILASTFFFVVEARQAGNDGPLAVFTTLAIYAAFRRLHGGPADEPPGLPGERLGGRGWATLAWVALGLGFLSKGPVVILLAVLAVVPYLALSRRLAASLRALVTWQGVALFLLLAMSWPALVILSDPEAVRVWRLEMGQKAGGAGIVHHGERQFFREWPAMTAPWTLLATWAVLMPFLGRGRSPAVWLPWSWAVGNFAMFCLWSVAKPNYYVPCEPGVALLAGLAWVGILRTARDPESRSAPRARRFVQFHWVGLAAVAIAVPPLLRSRAPQYAPMLMAPVVAASVAVAVGVLLSMLAWRRRADAGVLAALVGGMGVAVLIGYSSVVPKFNEAKSHRVLAAELDRMLPPGASTVMFYRQLDEGLWYYLKGRTLSPVPGTTPKYSLADEIQTKAETNTLIYDNQKRMEAERQVLVDWLDGAEHESPYLLIRGRDYDLFGREVADRTETVFRETTGERTNKLVLLKVRERKDVASGAGAARR